MTERQPDPPIEELVPLVHAELHRLAERYLAKERRGS